MQKKSSLLPVLGTVVLLAGGSGAGYWVYTQRSAGDGNLPVGATILPQTVLLTVTISTDEAQWNTLRSFGTEKTQAAFDQNLSNLRETLLQARGYGYDRDIKPWVGKEVTIAFLPPAPQSSPPPSPGSNFQAPQAAPEQAAILVLPIAKPAEAEKILKTPKPLKQGKWTNRIYQGVQVQETEGAEESVSASVVDNRFLVVTTAPKTTDAVIAAYKSGQSIAQIPGYSKALSQIKDDQPFGKLYVNIPAAAKLAAANSGGATQVLQQNQGLAATIALEAEGIRLKGVSWLRQDSVPKHTVENNAKDMPMRLPAETLLMASGSNLNNLWQQYTQTANSQAVPFDPKQILEGFKTATGMELDKDFFAWMRGEFSLALLPAQAGSSSSFPAGLVVMVDASDRAAADRSLTQLDQVMKDRYQLGVQPATVADKSVVNWTVPLVGNLVTRGWLDGNVAFLSLGAPTVQSFVPKPSSALSTSALFQKAVPAQPSPSSGRFFLNVSDTYKTLNTTNLPLSRILPVNEEAAKVVQTIGLTTGIVNDSTVRYELLVRLLKGNPPGPLPSPQVFPSPIPEVPTPSLPSP